MLFYLFAALNITPSDKLNCALAYYVTVEAENLGYFEESSKEVFEGGHHILNVKFI